MCFLLLVSSLPASQLTPLDWVTCCVGLLFPEYFQLFHSLPSARTRFLTRGVHLSRDAFPAPVVKTTLIWLPPCPPHLPSSMLPISIYVPLVSILSTFYRSGIVLNSFHIYCDSIHTASLWNRHCYCSHSLNEETDLQGLPPAGSSTLTAVVAFLFSLTHPNNFLSGHVILQLAFFNIIYLRFFYLNKIYLLILIAVFHFGDILHWWMFKLLPICSCYSIDYNTYNVYNRSICSWETLFQLHTQKWDLSALGVK